MPEPETVLLPSPLHTGSPLAELLANDPDWPDGAIEEVLRIGSAAAGAIVVALIETRRRDRVEDRVLFRACRLAGVLRVRAALPLLVDLALDWQASDAAANVAMRAAKSFGEYAHELGLRGCVELRLEVGRTRPHGPAVGRAG